MFDSICGLTGGVTDRGPLDDFWYRNVGVQTTAGIVVNESTALTYSTFWACVSKLSKTFSTLPGSVVESSADNRTRNRVENPLNEIMYTNAAGNGSGVAVRNAMCANALVWGIGYAEITWTNDMRPHTLTNIPTRHVTQAFDDKGKVVYWVREKDGGRRQILAENMLVLPGMSMDGVTPLSVIGFHRQSIGLGLATTNYGAAFFGNGARPGGLITLPPGEKVSAETERRIVDQWNETHQGTNNGHRVAFMRQGMTWTDIGIPNADSQYLETKQFSREDMYAILDVPPNQVQDLHLVKFNNVEQQNLNWTTGSILPWCVRLEVDIKRKFFQNEPLSWRHNLAGLLRGDLKSRNAAYLVGRNGGWLSVNDIRLLEDMNPIEGGDEYLVPLNMIPAGTPRDDDSNAAVAELAAVMEVEQPKTDVPAISHEPQSTALNIEPLCLDAAHRIVTKECKAVAASCRRRCKEDTIAGFVAWLVKFYDVDLIQSCRIAFDPLFHATVESISDGELASYAVAEAYCSSHRDMAMQDPASVPRLCEEWSKDQPDYLAEILKEQITKLTENTNVKQ